MPLFDEVENGNFVRATDEEIVEEETIAFDKCAFDTCKKQAVAKGVWLETAKVYNLCSAHLDTARSNPKSWRVLTQ